jgi:hypothetical protein
VRKRSIMVGFRMEPDELEIVKARARALGLNLCAYLRHSLNNEFSDAGEGRPLLETRKPGRPRLDDAEDSL